MDMKYPRSSGEYNVRVHGDRDHLTPVERLQSARGEFEQVLSSMRQDIDAGRWDLIVGDDVSGRVPTLVLSDVIKKRYSQQGHQAPEVRFIVFGQGIGEDDAAVTAIKTQISQYGSAKRALFVTDNVGTGDTIRVMGEALDAAGILGDVVSVDAHPDTVDYAMLQHSRNDPEARAYGVNTNDSMQRLHAASFSRPRFRQAIGVERHGDVMTEANRQNHYRQTGEFPEPNPEISELRLAIKAMADELYLQTFKASG